MSKSDKDNAINQPPSPEDENAMQEHKSEHAPESGLHIFERLNQTLTKAASGQSLPGVVRIPRADRKSVAPPEQSAPQEQPREQSKVISLKRRTSKLISAGETETDSAAETQTNLARHSAVRPPVGRVPSAVPPPSVPTPAASQTVVPPAVPPPPPAIPQPVTPPPLPPATQSDTPRPTYVSPDAVPEQPPVPQSIVPPERPTVLPPQQSVPQTSQPPVEVMPQPPVEPVSPPSVQPTAQVTPAQPAPTQPHKIDLQGATPSSSTMLPLIDRMEQQINKVTSNLMTRVDQALAKLEEDAGNLEKNGLSTQEQDQTALSKLCNNIENALHRSAEDAQSKVLDKSTAGQRSIQAILEEGQTTVDQQSKESIDALLKRSKGMRIEHGELTQVAQKKFSSLVKQRASDVQSLIEMIKSDWEKLTASELQGLEERDSRATELVSKETDSISSTFDQYCQSLERDLDEAWEQSSYEVNLTRKQCIAAVSETLKIWQQRLILLTKSVIDSDVVPRLKELRDQLDNQVEELKQQFSARNEAERSVQMNDVEAETTELKRRFRVLATDAEASIYDTITDQQEGISQLFINHRDDIQTILRNAEDELESLHAKLKKSDSACRKLLISSAATLGLSLATEREKLVSNLQELRRTTLQAMDDRLHQDLATLEESGKHERSVLADCGAENTRLIKEKCKTSIAEIQADVEQAFREIQKTREKFLQQ